MSNKLSRRQFLSSGGKLAVGANFLVTMNHFEMASAALAQSNNPPTDYRALAWMFLLGGNDASNMLIPRSNAEYQNDSLARQSLAVPQNDFLRIPPLTAQNADPRSLRGRLRPRPRHLRNHAKPRRRRP